MKKIKYLVLLVAAFMISGFSIANDKYDDNENALTKPMDMNDKDNDGIPDAQDKDDDNDGIPDTEDTKDDNAPTEIMSGTIREKMKKKMQERMKEPAYNTEPANKIPDDQDDDDTKMEPTTNMPDEK